MRTIVFILYLASLFTRAESSVPQLDCTNNCDREMMCSLTSDSLSNCFEYSLHMTRLKDELFKCHFQEISPHKCECTLHVLNSFVPGEDFRANLLRGEEILFSTDISTKKSIKPKQPVILSVSHINNEDFLVTWNTNYNSPFNETLIPQLTYGVKGSPYNKTISLANGQTEHEIVGRELQPSATYTVKARVKSDLSDHFSEYSEPFEFTTPSSTTSIFKIIIPILCIILIVCICTVYYCYSKVLREWWDKIPHPKIATHFVKQVPRLMSMQSDFSHVYLDSSKLDHGGEKTWIASSEADAISQNSHHSLKQEGNSSQVIYAQAGYESVEGNSSESNSQWEPLEENKTPNHQEKSIVSNVPSNTVQNKCKNISGLVNMTYLKDVQNKLGGHLTSHLNQSQKFFTTINLTPVIQTDFEYGPCTGCATQFTPSSSETIVVPGYESVSEVMESSNKLEADAFVRQAFISNQNDVNLNIQKLVLFRNPQNVVNADSDTIIPAKNEYQDFQSLCRKTGEVDQSVSQVIAENKSHDDLGEHDLLLNHLCTPALHISTGIPIDCSYHKV